MRSWGWALGLPILLCGGAFGAALLVGAGQLQPLHITGFTVGSFAVDTVLNVVVMMVILLGEEIGWRGFMLPRIQQLTTRRRAAVVTGFAHGCFHLPLILIATTYDAEGARWIVAPVTVLTITAAGVFYAWLKDRSGSVWPADDRAHVRQPHLRLGLRRPRLDHPGEPGLRGGGDRRGHSRRRHRAGRRAAREREGVEDRPGRTHQVE